jgi:hypothetical protein
MNAAQFTTLLVQRFPAIARRIRREHHQIYNQMGIFSDYTQQAIDCRDYATVVRCFRLADEVIDKARVHRDLLTALYVSYLEHIDLSRSCETRLQSLMSPKLLRGYLEMHNLRDKCKAALSKQEMKGLHIQLLQSFREKYTEQGAAATP